MKVQPAEFLAQPSCKMLDAQVLPSLSRPSHKLDSADYLQAVLTNPVLGQIDELGA